MKKLLLAVLADEEYSNRFADYINHHKSRFFDLMVFTVLESMRAYAKNSKIDVLLIDGRLLDEISGVENIKKIIVLSDDEYAAEQNGHDSEEYPSIFKFQSAALILDEILSLVAEDEKMAKMHMPYNTKHAALIVFFSPSGGMGTSTYARKVCQRFGRNYKTLYVNLEMFDSFAEFARTAEGRNEYICGMSEIAFYIKQKKNNLALKLEAVIKHNGDYAYILPAEDYRDLYDITPSEMDRFVDALIKETSYERIVVDAGYMSEAVMRLFSVCDALVIPKPIDEIQKNKQRAFERLLSRNDMGDLVKNLKFVDMKEVNFK